MKRKYKEIDEWNKMFNPNYIEPRMQKYLIISVAISSVIVIGLLSLFITTLYLTKK